MTVYATNLPIGGQDVKGIIKHRNGADYVIPIRVRDFVVSGITMDDIVYQSSHLTVTPERQGIFIDQAQPQFNSYTFRFKGYIEYSTDFPYPRNVSRGDMYIVKNDQVTDNSIGRTNTGQTFHRENEIFWDGDNWELSDSTTTGLTWKLPVLTITNTPPGSPSDGDRYLLGDTPTGVWASYAHYIVEWSSDDGDWRYEAPTVNAAVFVEDTDGGYTYDADTGVWIQFSGLGQVTAGAGLSKTGNQIDVELATGSGLGFDVVGDAGKLQVEVIDGGELL